MFFDIFILKTKKFINFKLLVLIEVVEMKGGKIYGILPDIMRFPGEDEDMWDFVIDEDYYDDEEYEHKLLIAKNDRMVVNVNESGVYIMVPLKFKEKVEKIIKELQGFDVETVTDDVGETFDININVEYDLDEDSKVYVYDSNDIKTLEKVIQDIYLSL